LGYSGLIILCEGAKSMSRNSRVGDMILASSLSSLLILTNCSAPSNGSNSASIDQSASPTPVGIATATQTDASDDVIDKDGRKPSGKLNGIDLIGLKLEVIESNLRVTFEANESIPTSIPAGESALWQVEVLSGDKTQGYLLGAKLVGAKWEAFIFNSKTATNVYVHNLAVDDKKLVANFPLNQLPNLIPPFTWSASTEYSGKLGDKVPNEGQASFPSSKN
jgi:hypothetical protein